MVFCSVGALAGLTFLALALTVNTPVQASVDQYVVSVSITESGFDPAVMTVTVGTSVVWTNHTQEVARLVSGEPYRIYLPLMLRNAGGTIAATASPPMTTAADLSWLQDDWGSGDIAPGESYTHTFTTAGDHPYFLATHPDRRGLIVVGIPALEIHKDCDPDTGEDNRLACTISVENTSLDDANIVVFDRVPSAVYVDPASVVGATQTGPNTLEYSGFLAGAGAPIIQIDETLIWGYISLADLGVDPFPLPPNPDEGCWGITGLDFYYLNEHYTDVIWSINGTVEVGQAGGTTETLLDVWGSSGGDVFAVGSSGRILHYDGMGWSAMTSGTYNQLNSVWGSSGSDVFAVGEGGTILHYDGAGWSTMNSGTVEWLSGVWGNDLGDVFAVGSNGTILHYDGTAWSPMTSGTASYLYDVWGSSGSDVFAVGWIGTMLHYDGMGWSDTDSGTIWDLYGLWGSSGSDVFAVGDWGTIRHYNGMEWSAMGSGTTEILEGVWGSSGSDVFAVGQDGTILHYDDTTWTAMPSGTSEWLTGVWGSSGSDVFAVGFNGTILHYDGTGWSAMPRGYCTTDANQDLPDTSIPNNLLAPWWTDLNLTDSGNWYQAGLSIVNDYTVFEWEDAPRAGDPSSTATFQIWILDGTDLIWFTYGGFTGDTSDGTVGAEDDTGAFGDTYYFDGTGTLPVVGVDLQVTQVPGTPGDSHTIYFEANGVEVGPFTNCAEMTADTFDGVAFGCDESEVLPY